MNTQTDTDTATDLAHYAVSANGIPMGVYCVRDEDAALEAYARDAGYDNYETLMELHPPDRDEWSTGGVRVALVDDDETARDAGYDDYAAMVELYGYATLVSR